MAPFAARLARLGYMVVLVTRLRFRHPGGLREPYRERSRTTFIVSYFEEFGNTILIKKYNISKYFYIEYIRKLLM
jgi:hypothetical protein